MISRTDQPSESTRPTASIPGQPSEPSHDLSCTVISLAIAVHRNLGPGLLESVYESALAIELRDARMSFGRQVPLPVVYKGETIGDFRADLIIENSLLIELKSVERHDPVFEAQVLTYLKISGLKLGLLFNFNNRLLKDGIKRIIL